MSAYTGYARASAGGNELVPIVIDAASQALTGAGGGGVDITLTEVLTRFTSANAGDVLDLADGTVVGQLKCVTYVAENAAPDTGVVTPASFADGATVTLTSVGDAVSLIWNGSAWRIVQLIGTAVLA